MPLKEHGDKLKKTIIFDADDYATLTRIVEKSKKQDNKELNSISKIIRTAIKQFLNNRKQNSLEILTRYTYQELENYFDFNEAVVLCDIMNGVLYEVNTINPKIVLVQSVIDAVKYDDSDSIQHIDADVLIEKLQNLSEFQSYVVIQMAFEFWGKNNEQHERQKTSRPIEEIFLIMD